MTVTEFITKENITKVKLGEMLGIHRRTIYQRESLGWTIGYHVLDGKKRIGWTKPEGGVWFD